MFNPAYGQRIVKQTLEVTRVWCCWKVMFFITYESEKANVWKYFYTFVKFKWFTNFVT